MSVHYKFKSSLDFDTISFDGLHISVSDLKKEIINKKKLGKTLDFDLQITNAQTKEEYSEDSCLIPKNTSLIIARVPLATRLVKKAWDPTAEKVAASASARERKNADAQAANIDLTLMNGTEEEKINAMMKQSTMDYDPRNYQKVRGSAQTGEVPSTYRCYKCNKMGHWIKNCPLNAHHDSTHTEIKRSTGIPRSFIDAGNSPATEPINLPPVEKKQEIPDDLICSICKDLFTDAVMIPCCGSSFCDECVRTALLESEDNECPDCQEKGSSPGSLIPNRFLRNSVNSFKNETGYNKPRQLKKAVPPVEENVQPQTEEVASKTPPIAKVVSEEEKSASTEGNKSNPPEAVESKEQENDEASRECDTSRAESPHDESDYEDNIIVTVPKPQSQNNYHDYRDRQNMNGRYNRSTEVEQQTNQSQSHQYADKDSYSAEMKHMSEMNMNMNMRYGMQQQHQQQHPPIMQQPMQHRQGPPNPMQPNNFHQNPSAGGPNTWWNHPNRYGSSMPGMHQKDMKPNEGDMHSHQQMNQMHHRSYGPIPHQQQQQMPIRGYAPVQHHLHPQIHRPMMHQESNIVATAFQGVASKIGTGIIEDPLAAFEQIMKEKERRKIQRRAAIDSPPRRRSRSGERRRSSMDRRSPRHNSPDSRDRGKGERSSSRNRDRRNDKRGRSPDRRRSPTIERRSYYSRQSRSYSRSSRSNTPPRRHSRSPPRKHSRSPQDRRSRSRSTSYTTSRNRYRESSRRDYRDREEYRDRSPNFYHGRGRGSYRGRGRGNYYRQHQQHHQHQPGGAQQNPNIPYYDQSMNIMNTGMASGQGGYNDGVYHDTQSNRYAPVPVHSPSNVHGGLQPNHEFASQIGHAVQEIHPVESNHYSNEGNQSFASNHSYDVLPPGVDREPPPPGFENEEQHAQHHPRQHVNRDSRSPTRSNNERERGDRSERKHHSKSPSSREQVRSKSGDNRNQYEKEDKKEINKSFNRTKDTDKKDLQREKERFAREKEKEREKDREKDDDKRERKSKDKKKKKKEDKSIEKKRKKDKKEKREKDVKKSSKNHSHYSSGNEEKRMNSSEKEMSTNKASPDSRHENVFSHSTTPPPLPQQKNVHKSATVEEDANIDLYGDINIEMENEGNNPNEDFGITNSPACRLSDSILDIHTTVDFEEADLPKSESEAVQSKQIPPEDAFVTLPEPSKWERDEELLAEKSLVDSLPVDDQTKVTNEVLKRAENAIFARAINAIRPSIEIKKICPERQKLYSNEVVSEQEKSPTISSTGHVEKVSDNSLQITVLNSEQERSVEIKSGTRQQRNKTPIRSIKDRLGKKLNEENARSKSRTPQRKIVTENRNDRARSRSKERRSRGSDRRRDRNTDSDKGRKYRSPKSNDNRRSSVTRRNDPQKTSEKSYREKERRRNSSDDHDAKENKDRKKSGRVGNEKDSSDLGREEHKLQIEKATRDTERERELQKARVRARIREEERTKAQREDNSSTKEKRSTSSFSTADRRKRTELANADNQNVGSMIEGKHHDLDESHFEPNYEAHPSDESPLKSKLSDHRMNRSKSKTKTDRKRSRSYSSSSSSSSDSNSSDSSSDSEERKRKRKRKHKKQKKSKKSKKKKKTKK